MSDDKTSGVERLVRQSSAVSAPTPDLARRVEEAVRAGVSVEFFHWVGYRVPAFRLRLGHGALQVADGRGRHLGAFASGAAAIRCGWERSLPGRSEQRGSSYDARCGHGRDGEVRANRHGNSVAISSHG